MWARRELSMAMRTISFKASTEQYQQIKMAADAAGISPGQWAKAASLGSANHADVVARIDAAKLEIIDYTRVSLRKVADYLAGQMAPGKKGE